MAASGCSIRMIAYGAYVWIFPNWLAKLGSLMTVIGIAFVVYQLRRRGASRSNLPNGIDTLLEFHRRELVRRRDFFRTSWLWYLSPFVPGLVVFVLGMAQTLPDKGPLLILLAVIVVSFFAIGLFDEWRARRLQQQIDALSAMSVSPSNGLRDAGQ